MDPDQNQQTPPSDTTGLIPNGKPVLPEQKLKPVVRLFMVEGILMAGVVLAFMIFVGLPCIEQCPENLYLYEAFLFLIFAAVLIFKILRPLFKNKKKTSTPNNPPLLSQ